MRGRYFPIVYYEGEILTEVEARRQRKSTICIIVAIFSIGLGAPEIEVDTNGYQTRTEIHKLVTSSSHPQNVVNELRGGVNLTEAAWVLITLWMLSQSNSNIEAFQPIKAPHHQLYPSSKNPHNFKTTSSSERGTQLEGRKRHRAEIPIDMDNQYTQFMLTKNPNTNCSQQRFKELCCDSQTGIIDLSSIDEALGILEAEGRGLVKNASRPEKSVIDADFEIEGPGRYDLADLKTPINWGKGNENLDQAAEHVADLIINQRVRFQRYGKNPLHIVNLIKLDPNERADYKQNVINTIGSSKDLVFINEEVKI
jgi:hypothetical protein